ncbi:preprotein translocase subunit SecA [Corynebacterium bovis]|uniref:DUF5926 family protein n=1 Tax=Corynebacterium bovis TaxID=36808 RepID=UPI000F64ECA5|nr:DUF5926 family protein [Corynebacterium bovis]RRO81055.1 preprotein translocase subunit SecA [Corynebacterium bovis]RRO90932.1 preprotein translocase subunit SecA [Corynebacterium bovis]
MAKKNRKKEDLPEGMSRRQAKLAARAAERAALEKDPRAYEGYAAETDLVALQEFVPSAHVRVRTTGIDRPVSLCTVLPGAVSALVRAEDEGGEVFVALQTQQRGNNPQRDLAFALSWAASAAPGSTLEVGIADGTEPPVTDLLPQDQELDIEVADDFAWWLPESQRNNPQIAASLEQANASVLPSRRLDVDVPGAVWWIDPGEKAHIRWVRPEAEDELLDALARVAADGGLHLGENTRFAGAFRTHGLLVPVFDLDNTVPYTEFAGPVAELDRRISAALETGRGEAGGQLTAEEHKAKQTIIARQVTIR